MAGRSGAGEKSDGDTLAGRSLGQCFRDEPARHGCQSEQDQYGRDRDNDSSVHG
ncbi:hypothetical protein HSR121_1502 [Halapricum desulfuricans]|uniref:Uncharacterized protein n=1 Tax=Halapricum desulfuricans TaxID=2841257 RepID=A0A897N4Q2_9EURY|nr:hypothetical protein HSR121_1502 [Halapricum desulfuricans]